MLFHDSDHSPDTGDEDRGKSTTSAVEHALLVALVAGGIIVAADEISVAVAGEMTVIAACIDGTTTVATC